MFKFLCVIGVGRLKLVIFNFVVVFWGLCIFVVMDYNVSREDFWLFYDYFYEGGVFIDDEEGDEDFFFWFYVSSYSR